VGLLKQQKWKNLFKMIELLIACLSLQILLPSTLYCFHFPSLQSTSRHAHLWLFALLDATTRTFKLKPKGPPAILFFLFFFPLIKTYGARDFWKGKQRGRRESWLWSSGYFLTIGEESYFGNLLERRWFVCLSMWEF
jgi:hypothetical protein